MSVIPWWIKYPYVNDEIQNLDWLLAQINENTENITDFINLNTIKYADPIEWDITSQYEANTIVVDPQSGDAYISTTAVPYGVSLSNTDYWTKIYNYANAINNLQEQIAIANEELSTTATEARAIGDLVWLNGELYEVTAAMIAGDSYIEDSNCIKTTIEDYINTRFTTLDAKVGELSDLTTTDQDSIVDAINEVDTNCDSNATNIGTLSNLNTTDKDSLVDAINEVDTNCDNNTTNIGDLTTLNTSDQTSIVAAINEVIANRNYVTPEEFGAVGDGVTDDSTAFQNAINSNKPVLCNSSANYYLSNYLLVLENTMIIGNGASLTFDSTTPLYSSSLIVGNGTDNVKIYGLNIDLGSNQTLSHAISFFSSNDCIFENCTFSNSYGYAFRINYCEHFIFEKCHFKNITGDTGNPGGAIYGINWVRHIINNCTCDTLDDHFIYITGDSSEAVRITNCIAVNCGQGTNAPGAAYVIYANATNIVIDNCADIDCAKGGIRMEPYTGYSGAPSYITINNHYSYNSGANGIDAICTTSDSFENLKITNCTIRNCGQDAIRVENGNYVQILNCSTTGSTRTPFEIDADDVLIANCVVDETTNYGMILGLRGPGVAGNCYLYNNVFTGCTAACIYARNVTGALNTRNNYALNNIQVISGASTIAGSASVGESPFSANNRSILFQASSSESVYHAVGDIIFNSAPSSGTPIGWVCTAAGTPGTLEAMANL